MMKLISAALPITKMLCKFAPGSQKYQPEFKA